MDTSRTTLGSPGALKWLHTRSVGVTFRIYRAEYQQSRTYIVQSAALLACSLGICGVCMLAALIATRQLQTDRTALGLDLATSSLYILSALLSLAVVCGGGGGGPGARGSVNGPRQSIFIDEGEEGEGEEEEGEEEEGEGEAIGRGVSASDCGENSSENGKTSANGGGDEPPSLLARVSRRFSKPALTRLASSGIGSLLSLAQQLSGGERGEEGNNDSTWPHEAAREMMIEM
ncbi:hypothetical protein EMIHUDRAFT_442753 [Emiliania huxleyi CCMP1516]|uniref:Transmembrane protein n=2 Tax=Emiliania huxleyi TaxID=2903 RepID=A0A0D3K1F1_EMIH1|nr:hypothetical protein EMIHUDRAFT_442753 [Emiliania huxleyi CCMP1516]EOD29586.1 hypothetical protein EMIHUDRAFT_442753 [Emiliania huxleyi CCMP1516]|eukprot:XP_005782015.1 hypothetical protein EMIHUDRAFT_442753 [Emiliania huxleyi CCMP1516]